MRDLPEGWTVSRLADVAEVRLGRQRSPSRATGDHMCRYLRAANVTWAGIDLEDVKEMDFTPAEQEMFRLRRGDILMSEASGSASEVGKPAIWNDELPNVCFQNTLLRVRPPLGLTKYLYWHLMADAVLGNFVGVAPGVGIHHLGASRLSDWSVRLAPEDQRDAIVAEVERHITRIDAGVAALKRVQANLKRYRASVLKAAVEGRLVPTEAELARKERRDYEPATKLLARILKERRARWEADELAKLKAKGRAPTDDRWKAKYKEPERPDTSELPELPEGWCWATVEQLTSRITSGSRDWSPYYDRGSSVFLMAQNVRPGRLDLSSFRQLVDPPPADASRERSQVLNGDVLVTIVGANTGDACRVTQELPEHYVCQSVALLRPVLSEISQYFMTYLISPEHGRRQFERFMYGQGRPHLSFEQLASTIIALPPLGEQERLASAFAAAASNHEALETAVSQAIARGERLRRAVLRAAFEGKLVPQAPAQPEARPLDSKTTGSSRPASAVRTRGRRANLSLGEKEAP